MSDGALMTARQAETRKKALLEAALMCSKYADNLMEDRPEWAEVAQVCAVMIEELANSDVHFYPPGKPVIDKDMERP